MDNNDKRGPGQILKVAARLFAENGYSNVSIRDVCKEANTTPPMIYYYFKDKRGLFDAAVRHRVTMREFIDSLRERSTSKADVRADLSAFIDTYLSDFPTSAFEPGLYMTESARLDDRSASQISGQLDEVREIAVSLVERGINSSQFRETDARAAAECLIGMLNHVVFQRIHFSRTRDLAKSKPFILDFFLRAMAPASIDPGAGE